MAVQFRSTRSIQMITSYDFKRPKQTIFVDPDNPKVAGDCWRCCVATVLQLPASEVPHFLQIAIDNGKSNEDAQTQAWLNVKGLFLLHSSGKGDSGMFYPYCDGRHWQDLPPIIACGPTTRSKHRGEHHAVVMQEGRTVYDPHPDETGLLYCVDWYAIVKPAIFTSP
jgi:hypothetical protein